MFSLALRRLVLLLLLCLSFAPCAQARRGTQSLDANIRQSDLIVIGDTRPGENSTTRPLRFSVVLSIATVLKGEPQWAGQSLDLPRAMSFEDPLPREAKNIAVLLKRLHSPAGEEVWSVQETYAQPDEIAAIKALIPIYALPNERAQLLALRELWKLDNPVLRAQFIGDLGQMHEAENFDLMLDFYPQADSVSQKRMVEILGRIGDERALPLLISILENEKADEKVRYSTAWQLNFYFPGAPGVTDAFRRVFPRATGNLQVLAAQYLNAREPDAKYRAALPLPVAWWGAEKLYQGGDDAGAWELWRQVLAEPQPSEFQLSWSVQYLLPYVKTADKPRVRAALLPLLRGEVASNKYLYPESAAKILRAVGEQDDVDLLLKLLDKPDSFNINARARFIVTMALRELGATARQMGAAHLLQTLREARTAQQIGSDETQNVLLELTWLANEDDWQNAQAILGNSWQTSGQKLNGLFVAINGDATGNEEISALISLLETPRDVPLTMQEWIIFRLGDRETARAVPVLTKFLDALGLSNWPATAALKQIGQSSAEHKILVVDAAIEHLRDPDDGVRTQAIHLIETLQGEKARPLLRRMVLEADFGFKMEAMSALSRVGTPEDLPILLPLADFWTAPRGLQSWASSAVTNIRDRFDLDVGDTAPKA